MNYYELYKYVSNSQLGSLDNVLTFKKMPEGIQKIFDFGNLVDAMKTEQSKVNHDTQTVKDESGRIMTFTDEEWQKGKLMTEALDADPLLSRIIMPDMKFQHVVLREKFTFEYAGITAVMPVRCKFDGLRLRKLGLDIKTTGCTNYKQFVESIFHFCYDRQGAFYMDLAGIDRMIYVGVSKIKNRITKKHEVFKFMIERGDETYLSGQRKYNYLGTRYFFYIYNLNLDLLTLPIKQQTNEQSRTLAF